MQQHTWMWERAWNISRYHIHSSSFAVLCVCVCSSVRMHTHVFSGGAKWKKKLRRCINLHCQYRVLYERAMGIRWSLAEQISPDDWLRYQVGKYEFVCVCARVCMCVYCANTTTCRRRKSDFWRCIKYPRWIHDYIHHVITLIKLSLVALFSRF